MSLAELNLTAQTLLQRAYQRDPQAIERWQPETYPALVSRAKRQRAQVAFQYDPGFRADAMHGKTWAERGQRSVVNRLGRRQSSSAASVVMSKGAFWFATYKGALPSELFVELLKNLLYRCKHPLHLVVAVCRHTRRRW